MDRHGRWVALVGLLLLVGSVPSPAAEFKSAKEAIEKGTALWDKGELDNAIAALTEAIRLDPKNYTAHLGRGRAYFSKSDYTKAIKDFTDAIQLNPKLTKAYLGRAAA
jgi:Tfp pilus assembly protein PilF